MSPSESQPPKPPESAGEIESEPLDSSAPDSVRGSTSNKNRRWLFFLPVLIGLLGFFLLNKFGTQAEPGEVREVARVLRVIKAARMEVAPRAIGYGSSKPGQIWQAVAEVSGRIVEIHPDLASGAFIRKDTALVKIDRRDYELALASSRAAIEQIEAQLSELSAQEVTTRDSLKIEERSLELAEESLRRQQSLLEQGLIPAESVDAEERTVLTQRQSVQSLKSTLAVIPSQRQSLEANRRSSQAQLSQAELDLERTTIKAPFGCRLGSVSLEKDQFVAAGQLLFDAYSLKTTEVEARFPPERLLPILSRVDLDTTTLEQVIDMEYMRSILNVRARVWISGFKDIEPWEARLDRIRETVDPETRTVGVVVVVDDPYKGVFPGRRPPLTKDLFCEVELKATEAAKVVVIPSSALRGGVVYTLNGEQRLEKRAVTAGFTQGIFVTVESGLQPGDLVLVTQPVPAIEGMLIDPVLDAELMSRLELEASGAGDVK